MANKRIIQYLEAFTGEYVAQKSGPLAQILPRFCDNCRESVAISGSMTMIFDMWPYFLVLKSHMSINTTPKLKERRGKLGIRVFYF